jgi:hypothetical protein
MTISTVAPIRRRDRAVRMNFCGHGVDTVHVEGSENSTHEIAPTCEIIIRNE